MMRVRNLALSWLILDLQETMLKKVGLQFVELLTTCLQNYYSNGSTMENLRMYGLLE